MLIVDVEIDPYVFFFNHGILNLRLARTSLLLIHRPDQPSKYTPLGSHLGKQNQKCSF